jgi:hypothetical protein
VRKYPSRQPRSTPSWTTPIARNTRRCAACVRHEDEKVRRLLLGDAYDAFDQVRDEDGAFFVQVQHDRPRGFGTFLIKRNIVNGTPAGETSSPTKDVMISRRTMRRADVSALSNDCHGRQHVIVLAVLCADACRSVGVP